MLWFSDRMPKLSSLAALAGSVLLASCTFQPLYSGSSDSALSVYPLTAIEVSDVDTRVAQQVRNHLIFLLRGGNAADPRALYELRLRVTDTNRTFASTPSVGGPTAGAVTVTVGYDLYENSRKERIARGSRTATASYDRTLQSFANSRAEIDAENRAARAAAEQIRLALAADLKG